LVRSPGLEPETQETSRPFLLHATEKYRVPCAIRRSKVALEAGSQLPQEIAEDKMILQIGVVFVSIIGPGLSSLFHDLAANDIDGQTVKEQVRKLNLVAG
jgi:hypothetical protein